MKKIFLLAMVLSVELAIAQSNLTPGYLVTTKGDTLRGFIVDRNNNWAVDEVRIASSETADPIPYRISELEGMYLKTYGATYFVRTLEIDMKPIETSALEHDGARKIETKTILIQQIVGGTLKLFDYTDINKKRHFIVQKGDGKTEDLPYLRYISAKGHLAEMAFYEGTLKGLTSDCQRMPVRVGSFDEKPLVKYISAYNKCVGSEVETHTTKSNSLSISFFASAAPGKGHFEGASAASGFLDDPYVVGNYTSVVAFSAGLNFELTSARASTRTRPGLLLAVQSIPKMTRPGNGPSITNIMKFSVAKVGPYFKYMLSTEKKANFYLKGSLGALIVSKGEAVRVTSGSADKNFANFKNFGYTFGLSFGVDVGAFSTDVGFNQSVMDCELTALAKFTSVDLAVGYRFKK